MLYSSSWLRRRALPLVTLMLSCLARSTIALRLRADTLLATSAAYFLRRRDGQQQRKHICHSFASPILPIVELLGGR